MDEQKFRQWLFERGIDGELIDSIVSDSNRIEELYADQVEVGAALDHSVWLDDLTSSTRGEPLVQVLWVMAGMIGALIAYIEQSEE